MGKQPCISPTRCARIVQLHLKELSYRKIQKKIQCSLKLYKLQFDYKNTVSIKDKGRPRITTLKHERIVYCLSSTDRRLTAVDIKKHIKSHYDAKLSVSTVKNMLKHYGLNG